MKKNILLILLLIGIIFSDLYSKSYVKSKFAFIGEEQIETNGYSENIEVTSFLNFKNLCNSGVSFGMFSGMEKKYITILISGIFIILLFYSYFYLKLDMINVYSIIMIIGGAIANLIDRIKNGCVYDFIDFHTNNHHWYVFNIADSFITIGTILILFNFKTSSKNQKHKN